MQNEISALEKKAGGAMAIIWLAGGLIFLSPALTGNIVGNMTNSTANWIGGILFVSGLVGAILYFKRK